MMRKTVQKKRITVKFKIYQEIRIFIDFVFVSFPTECHLLKRANATINYYRL